MFKALLALPVLLAPLLPQAAPTYKFDDEFTYSGHQNSWVKETGSGWDNGLDLETYRGSNAITNGNGILEISATQVAGKFYSARLQTLKQEEYGTVSVRAKMSVEDGAWPAIWVLGEPEDNWPVNGEMDMQEGGLGTPAEYHVHTPAGGPGGTYTGVDPTQWHVYSLVWTAASIKYEIDGKVFATYTGNYVPHSPAEVVLNVAVGDAAGTPANPWKTATMDVDYVRWTN